MLLRRYGVVCWRLLEREAQWLPPWRELLREYQRLEARGEIRGGRFIAGAPVGTVVTGEAVALHRGRSTQVWQTTITNAEGKLCAVVTQTQLVLQPDAGAPA